MHNTWQAAGANDAAGFQQQGNGSFFNTGGPTQGMNGNDPKYHSNIGAGRRRRGGASSKAKLGSICKCLCLLVVVLLFVALVAFAYMRWTSDSRATWESVPGIERLNQKWNERQERMKREEQRVGQITRDTQEPVRTRDDPAPPNVVEETPPRVHVERTRRMPEKPASETPPVPPAESAQASLDEVEYEQPETTHTEEARQQQHHEEPFEQQHQQQVDHHDPPQPPSHNPDEVVTVDDDDIPMLDDEAPPPISTGNTNENAQEIVPPLHFHPEAPVNISYNEYHQQALHHVLENVLHSPNHYRPKGMTLIHFSSHYDLEVPFILHGSYLKSWKKFSSHVSTRAYLMPLVYLGLVKRIVWIRPSWAKSSLQDQRIYKFTIGNVGDSDRLAIDNMELVKAGLLHTGYTHKSKMEHRKEGELVVIEGEYAAQQAASHPDSLLSGIMRLTPQSDVVFNLDDSYFSAQNPLLNWLNTEESIHHKDFNIHAAVNVFNPESYCMEKVEDERLKEEFSLAFRAFYRTSERGELSESAFKRLTEAIKPFWCSTQKLDYAMQNFKLVIHTVLHDEELSKDPELENIVQRLKDLNVYPHHVSSEKQKDSLFGNLETLMGMVLDRIHKSPFSTSVVLSLRDHLVPDTDKNVIMNRVHHMMRRLFGRVKLLKGFDRQVYSFSVSPNELKVTRDEDRATMGVFETKKRKRAKKEAQKREKRYQKLKRQRAELEREMREEAERRAALNARPPVDHTNDRRDAHGSAGYEHGRDTYYPMSDDPAHDNYESLEHDYEFDEEPHGDHWDERHDDYHHDDYHHDDFHGHGGDQGAMGHHNDDYHRDYHR